MGGESFKELLDYHEAITAATDGLLSRKQDPPEIVRYLLLSQFLYKLGVSKRKVVPWGT